MEHAACLLPCPQVGLQYKTATKDSLFQKSLLVENVLIAGPWVNKASALPELIWKGDRHRAIYMTCVLTIALRVRDQPECVSEDDQA